MKVLNRKKFIKSSSITIAIIVFLIILFTNISFSHNNINYKKVSVSSGDTLWSIAKFEQINNAYFYNSDIRDIIYEIQYINNLKNCNLKTGDNLNIPIP